MARFIYKVEYENTELSDTFLKMIRDHGQRLERVTIDTAFDCPVGLVLTLSCSPVKESARVEMLHKLNAFYEGGSVWRVL